MKYPRTTTAQIGVHEIFNHIRDVDYLKIFHVGINPHDEEIDGFLQTKYDKSVYALTITHTTNSRVETNPSLPLDRFKEAMLQHYNLTTRSKVETLIGKHKTSVYVDSLVIKPYTTYRLGGDNVDVLSLRSDIINQGQTDDKFVFVEYDEATDEIVITKVSADDFKHILNDINEKPEMVKMKRLLESLTEEEANTLRQLLE